MSTAAERIAEADRRRAILSTLYISAGFRQPIRLLQDLLGNIGYMVSRDRLATDCAWLAEQGLVTLQTVTAADDVVTLNSRGEDVVLGRSIVPGIQRPRPE